MNEKELRIAQGKRLEEARIRADYRSRREAAMDNGWPVSTYSAHERGERTIGRDDAERYARALHTTAAWIMFGIGSNEVGRIPLMGRIGAGNEIYPEYEQVPDDGLEAIEIPFPVPAGLVGFEVKGDSMMPRYDDGDVVICWRETARGIDALVGEELAVRTEDGRRFLKRVMRGQEPERFNLVSWNARDIPGVRLAWYSDIYLTIRAGQYVRINKSTKRPRR